ncbi:DNA cytosine methyltransferase [Anaerobiospirillum succiniciproducens]|uniref:DNA cytosine methyltransferase n=1 Tax=Anaerobiospirillum succiniciproducens TaxID=13335 RepID=UPI003F8C5F5F
MGLIPFSIKLLSKGNKSKLDFYSESLSHALKVSPLATRVDANASNALEKHNSCDDAACSECNEHNGRDVTSQYRPDFAEQLAIITHYLHHEGTDFVKPYEAAALALIEGCKDYVEAHRDKRFKKSSFNKDALDVHEMFKDIYAVPFAPTKNPNFSFVDLFAGIGGFRLALQNLGGRCVFSSEWDYHARSTYLMNYGEMPFGDITQDTVKAFIPDNFDILCAGFPCQAFSLAGKRRGFEETRGTLFFDVAKIIKLKQPKAFFLENVKGLTNHDKGKTLKTILKVLREDLGYYVPDVQLINARDFGLAQHRERIYIVGFRSDLGISSFDYPSPTDCSKTIADIKEQEAVDSKYYLSQKYLNTLIAHKERHSTKGNGFGYEVLDDNDVANAIVVGGMGRERNLLVDKRLATMNTLSRYKYEINSEYIRSMTPREWARLQGYPENFIIGVCNHAAYRLFGNSVAVPAIEATAKQILSKLNL